jgi:hypothetical protein
MRSLSLALFLLLPNLALGQGVARGPIPAIGKSGPAIGRNLPSSAGAQTAAPTFNPVPGTYTPPAAAPSISVAISTITPSATIRYTTNGTDPTGASPVYSTPVVLSYPLATKNLRAYASASGRTDSAITRGVYTLVPKLQQAACSPAAGTYATSQNFTVSGHGGGGLATWKYTTDGSDPHVSGTATDGTPPVVVTVSSNMTIRGYWHESGYTDGDDSSCTYQIQAAAPTCNPVAGTYGSAQSVSLSSATPSNTIRYTVDGSAPGGGSSVYSSAISVPSSMTIRSYASASGYADSGITDCAYTIGGTYTLAAARSTTWDPGLNSVGGIPNRTTVCYTVPLTGDTSGATDRDNINAAINACGTDQVVQLVAGTYYVNDQGISIERSNVVLRGTLDGNGDLATTVNKVGGNGYSAVRIGNHWGAWGYGTSIALSANGTKGATSITLASAPGVTAGDLVLVDELRDASLWLSARMDVGGGDYPAAQGWFNRQGRFIGQILEVASVAGNIVNFNTPLHSTFLTSNTAQMTPFTNATRQYVGVEDIRFNNAVGGDTEGQISISHAKYSWVRHVESYMSGPHLEIMSSYRCTVRDSYFHDAYSYNFGSGSYIISFMRSSSDNLIENNIVVHANKVMLMRPAGGGNVIAYNYMTDGIASGNPGWQETGLNATHLAGSHAELFEGNQGFNAGADDTWGGTLNVTFFRNHLQGLNRNFTDTQDVAAAKIARGHYGYNFVANVLGFSGMTGWTYEYVTTPYYEQGIWELGYQIGTRPNGTGDASVLSTMLRDGNYDYVSNQVHWHSIGGSGVGNGLTPPGNATMPSSLYLGAKPAFFGAATWPWVEAQGGTKLYSLPARTRYDSGYPNRL